MTEGTDGGDKLVAELIDLAQRRPKRKPRPTAERRDIGRPVIRLEASERERAIDNVELLLIGSELGKPRGLYQRAGQVVVRPAPENDSGRRQGDCGRGHRRAR